MTERYEGDLPLATDADHSQRDTPWVVRKPAKPPDLDIRSIEYSDGAITITAHFEGEGSVAYTTFTDADIPAMVAEGQDVTVAVPIDGFDTPVRVDGNALVGGGGGGD